MGMNNTTPRPTQYDIGDLLTLGWITWESMGEENFYFTLEDGSLGFIKLG